MPTVNTLTVVRRAVSIFPVGTLPSTPSATSIANYSEPHKNQQPFESDTVIAWLCSLFVDHKTLNRCVSLTNTLCFVGECLTMRNRESIKRKKNTDLCNFCYFNFKLLVFFKYWREDLCYQRKPFPISICARI